MSGLENIWFALRTCFLSPSPDTPDELSPYRVPKEMNIFHEIKRYVLCCTVAHILVISKTLHGEVSFDGHSKSFLHFIFAATALRT